MVIASNATDAGSPFAAPEITGSSSLVPQVCNCSTAAARNVSAAASRTLSPLRFKSPAILAHEVVLPVPFTPTTKTVVVLPSDFAIVRGFSLNQLCSAALTAISELSPRSRFAISIIDCEFAAPRSDSIRDCRTSSQSADETLPPRRFAKSLPKIAMFS